MNLTHWIEREIVILEYAGIERPDCESAVVMALKQILPHRSSGQIVVNVSQGTPCSVTWREKRVEKLNVDRATV
jgi:hypothetical protein